MIREEKFVNLSNTTQPLLDLFEHMKNNQDNTKTTIATSSSMSAVAAACSACSSFHDGTAEPQEGFQSCKIDVEKEKG
jgi:hypothetical protein